MEEMEIGIIGKGAMGLALEKAFSINNKTVTYDSKEALELDPNLAPHILILAIPSDAKVGEEMLSTFTLNTLKIKILF